MERCKTCKHWRERRVWGRDDELTGDGFGACLRLPSATTVPMLDAPLGVEGVYLILNREPRTPGVDEAVVMECEGMPAELVTGADFGCTLHQIR